MSGAGLVVDGLSVTVRGRALVADASWQALPGEITALVGPNGAGKSTMLRAIAGVVPERAERAGNVLLDGERLDAMAPRARARRVALVEQLADAPEQLTAREAVRLGRTPHHRMLGFSLGDERLVDSALLDAGAVDLADRRLGELSGGELQRVHVARALAQQARLLLLDEPTNHLDIAAQLELLALVRRLAADRPVVMTVHDLALAATHADRVVLVDRGRVLAAGSPAAVLTADRIRSVYGVDASIDDHPDGVAIRYRRVQA
ncbi:ABC transporter ATP-binding protein [Agrococcus beijingensis]|uniref:ABC transporter ATP-binding protein n=1 Tax=Agrococcus beijingensis TaxID=3068634 RepID=UPI002741DEF2|nr:ABC transporter ATP-binding protein [Agrococcus sp. REN33]